MYVVNMKEKIKLMCVDNYFFIKRRKHQNHKYMNKCLIIVNNLKDN